VSCWPRAGLEAHAREAQERLGDWDLGGTRPTTPGGSHRRSIHECDGGRVACRTSRRGCGGVVARRGRACEHAARRSGSGSTRARGETQARSRRGRENEKAGRIEATLDMARGYRSPCEGHRDIALLQPQRRGCAAPAMCVLPYSRSGAGPARAYAVIQGKWGMPMRRYGLVVAALRAAGCGAKTESGGSQGHRQDDRRDERKIHVTVAFSRTMVAKESSPSVLASRR